MTTIKLSAYDITIVLGKKDPEKAAAYLGGTITSSLHENDESTDFSNAIHAVESIVLAHAVAGVDVTTPAYLEGIETAIETLSNQLN